MRSASLVLLLISLPAVAGCGRDPAAQARASLGEPTSSATYHSGFWAREAEGRTPLWAEAQAYCGAPDHEDRPNCRVVVAVDVTVRVLAIRPSEDLTARLREWIRGGTRELGLASPDVMPPSVPGQGFADPPPMPRPPGR
jgi:hypothetical protein